MRPQSTGARGSPPRSESASRPSALRSHARAVGVQARRGYGGYSKQSSGIAAVRQQLDQRDDQRRVDLLTALGWPLVATTRSCCTQATSNAQTTDKMIGPKNKPLIP
jgi:hypothetical protein